MQQHGRRRATKLLDNCERVGMFLEASNEFIKCRWFGLTGFLEV